MVKKKAHSEPHEEHADETWLIPYSDLLTLLLALFIVLFASSSLDKNKAAQIEYALAAAFNTIPTDQMSGSLMNFLDDVKNLELGDDVGIGSDSKGAVLDITSSILFEKDKITLRPEAEPILKKIAELLSGTRYKRFRVVVEGHTDDIKYSSAEYPSNWELSSARAGSIVRYFIKKGLKEDRFQAVGMAGIAPKYPNLNSYGEPIPENRARNRRVAIRVEI